MLSLFGVASRDTAYACNTLSTVNESQKNLPPGISDWVLDGIALLQLVAVRLRARCPEKLDVVEVGDGCQGEQSLWIGPQHFLILRQCSLLVNRVQRVQLQLDVEHASYRSARVVLGKQRKVRGRVCQVPATDAVLDPAHSLHDQ